MKRAGRWRSACITSSLLLAGCAAMHIPGWDEDPQSDAPAANAARPVARHAVIASRSKSDAISNRLIGMNETQLKETLGSPSVQSDRGPGKVWKYRDGRCAVDLTLYADVDTRIYHALSYEVISNDSSPEGKRNCIAEFEDRVRTR